MPNKLSRFQRAALSEIVKNGGRLSQRKNGQWYGAAGYPIKVPDGDGMPAQPLRAAVVMALAQHGALERDPNKNSTDRDAYKVTQAGHAMEKDGRND